MIDMSNFPGIPRFPRRNDDVVSMIVLHFGTKRNTEKTLAKRNVGTHFIVKTNGEVVMLCQPHLYTWHVAVNNVNRISIGIDLEDVTVGEHEERIRGKVRKCGIGTKEQIKATKELIQELCQHWGIPNIWRSPLANHRGRNDVLIPPFEPGIYAHGALQKSRWDGFTIEIGDRDGD